MGNARSGGRNRILLDKDDMRKRKRLNASKIGIGALKKRVYSFNATTVVIPLILVSHSGLLDPNPSFALQEFVSLNKGNASIVTALKDRSERMKTLPSALISKLKACQDEVSILERFVIEEEYELARQQLRK